MEQGLRALSAVSLPDGIYVLGGYNGTEYLDQVSRFDPCASEWT
jgi:hypothetical protein